MGLLMPITDSDHYRAYIKSPRIVGRRGKYIHETLHNAREFPRGTEFRTLRMGGHRLIVGYWGAKAPGGKHPYFAVASVLHPAEKTCRFKRRLAAMGVKLKPGKSVRLRGVVPLTGDRKKRIINPLRIVR
jgi:hypothetical protein